MHKITPLKLNVKIPLSKLKTKLDGTEELDELRSYSYFKNYLESRFDIDNLENLKVQAIESKLIGLKSEIEQYDEKTFFATFKAGNKNDLSKEHAQVIQLDKVIYELPNDSNVVTDFYACFHFSKIEVDNGYLTIEADIFIVNKNTDSIKKQLNNLFNKAYPQSDICYLQYIVSKQELNSLKERVKEIKIVGKGYPHNMFEWTSSDTPKDLDIPMKFNFSFSTSEITKESLGYILGKNKIEEFFINGDYETKGVIKKGESQQTVPIDRDDLIFSIKNDFIFAADQIGYDAFKLQIEKHLFSMYQQSTIS